MSPVRTSAPGKLLLFGEYAVLAGGTAVVMAVDRRARVEIEPVDSEDLFVTAPQLGLGGEGLAFDVEAPDRVLGLTGRLLAERLAHYGLKAAGRRIAIDTSALFDSAEGAPTKLGLGSSAAVAAALDAALAAEAGRPAPTLDDLLPAYRRAIGGPVSGADLAAALHGGLLTVGADGERLSVARIARPDGLHVQPIWLARPASTPAYAAAFDAWRQRDGSAAEGWVRDMDRVTLRAVEAGTAAAWVAAAGAWHRGLQVLEEAIGVEILTSGHRALADLAESHGVAYKTSGAGGGDFGIALATERGALDAFCEGASGRGGRPVELAIDESGTCIDAQRVARPQGADQRTPPGA